MELCGKRQMNKQGVLYLPVKKEGLIFSTDNDECKGYYRTLDGEEVSSSFKAKSKEELFVQLKPVIPKFVAEWIKGMKQDERHLYSVMISLMNKTDHKWTVWKSANMNFSEIVAQAWIYGYEIEQEKLYTVEIPNPNSAGGKLVFVS